MRIVRVAAFALATLAACHDHQAKVALNDVAPIASTPPVQARELFDDVDRSVDPCNDLYAFACNKWMADTKLTGDFAENDRSFGRAYVGMRINSGVLLFGAKDYSGNDANTKKVGAFYSSCDDEAAIDKAGIAPFKDLLAIIAAVHDRTSLSAAVAALYNVGTLPWFSFGPGTSETDSRQTIWWLMGKGLGLDFYRSDDPATMKRREKYRATLTAQLTDAGFGDRAAAEADQVFAFKAQLAAAQPTVAESRTVRIHQVVTKSQLPTFIAHFDWDEFWRDIHAKDAPITIGDPRPLVALDRLLAKTPWIDIQAMLVATLFIRYADALPKRLRSETDSRDCEAATWRYLGDEFANIYVGDQFDVFHDMKIIASVAAINHAMAEELAHVTWLDPQTRAEAEHKRSQILWKLSRPNNPKLHTGNIASDAFAQNLMTVTTQDVARQTATVGLPPDRNTWSNAPDSANASYAQNFNTIELPEAMLRVPFFDGDENAAINLGAIGMIIGHELTHAFDDQGAQYDDVGSERNWWQPATQQEFKRRSQCIVDQFNRYPAADTHVNGEITVGENIADLGGLRLAFNAYRSLASNAPIKSKRGFSPDQQFFLSFAQTFCRKATPAWERWALKDVHSPADWRINGTASAMPEFATAFQCKAGAPMAPVQRCEVW